MKKQALLLLVFGLMLSMSISAKQDNFEHVLPLQLKGENAAYVFDVPESVYQNVYYPNLSDLRIVNANSDFVPMKMIFNTDEIKHNYTQTSLPTFKLNKTQSTPINTKQNRITRAGNREDYTVKTSKSMRYFLDNQESQDNSVVYIDANVLKGQKIEKLSLDWQYQTRGNRIFYVKLSGSNDLSNWYTIKPHHKLLEIKSGTKTILENNIELNQVPYLYYQLAFKNKIIPEIKSVQAHLLSQVTMGVNKWLAIENITLIDDNQLVLDTQGYYSIESFKIKFKQKNSITDATFYSKNKTNDKWQYAGSGSLYSITTNGQTYSKDSVSIRPSQNRYWKIILDENIKNNSVNSIDFGWRTHQIEFLAQGESPFSMVFGNKQQSMRASNDWYSKLPKNIKFSDQVIISDANQLNKLNFKTQKQKEPETDQAKIIFWLVLSAVILFLGFMAYRLIRENNLPNE